MTTTDPRTWFLDESNQDSLAAKLAADASTRADTGPYTVDLSDEAITAAIPEGPARPQTPAEIDLIRAAFGRRYGADPTYRTINA
ncbi:hypothetical protein [Gordonia malaquae]|uniref:hypothetical protein n=1 Tax=Gordonia malaquae TaxID=410332 RepID=UPI00301A3C1C